MRSFWLALQFLTRLPTPSVEGEIDARLLGRSLAWYPLVGLLIGAILWGAALLLQDQASMLSAAVVLALWVFFTGALHLDGLADSADAWVGGLGDRQRTLAIMKDPASGPVGVTALVIVLLLKFAALTTLLGGSELLVLLVIPPLARSGVALLFITTPYVRAGGLGEALANHPPRRLVIVSALAVIVLLFGVLGLSGGGMLVAAMVSWFWLRNRVLKRLGGFTGDVAGALLEMLECAALLVLALLEPYM